MFDFDFGDAHASGGALDGLDSDLDADLNATSALDNVDLSDIERRLEGALAGFDVPASSADGRVSSEESSSPVQTPTQDENASSVWEDGEKFWNRTSLSTIPGSSPSDAEKARSVGPTPRLYASVYGVGGRRAHMRSPSAMATSRSLYDADGFLQGT
jgi:hypothetical protein